jgi:hypothetical protein
MVQLQSGIGMKGGPENPLGSRAMYLWSGNKDTNEDIISTTARRLARKSSFSGPGNRSPPRNRLPLRLAAPARATLADGQADTWSRMRTGSRRVIDM